MESDSPPPLRKQPRQSRSKALVESLIETCTKILLEQGPDQVTVATVAEESGIAPASIYDYFPTIEALIAQTLNQKLEDQLHRMRQSTIGLDKSTPLEEIIRIIVAESLTGRNELYTLSPELYLKYVDHYEYNTNEDRRNDQAINIIREILKHFEDQVKTSDLDYAIFLFVRTLQLTSRAILLEKGKRITSSQTVDLLTRMSVPLFI
jgi:AcrR family transcriptional regulator